MGEGGEGEGGTPDLVSHPKTCKPKINPLWAYAAENAQQKAEPAERILLSGLIRSLEMLMDRNPVWSCSPFDPDSVQTDANTEEGVNDH